jgi:hypothetical protein
VPASSSEIGISDFPYRMSEGQDGRMADAPPPASQPGTRVKLRYRPSMDEIIGAVEEDTQISRRAPRRDAVEDGAEFFWHLRPDSSGQGHDVEVLSHFVVPHTSRRTLAFWKDQGLSELGIRIQSFVQRSPQRSVRTMSDPRLHVSSTDDSVIVAPQALERPVSKRSVDAAALLATFDPTERRVLAVRPPMPASFRSFESGAAGGRPSDQRQSPADAADVIQAIESLCRVLDRLSPQSDEAVTRLVHLRHMLRKMASRLHGGGPLPSSSASASDLVGGGMGLTPQELEDLRSGITSLADLSTWPKAITRLRRVTRSLGGGDDV